jgi:hypothetical protein
MSGLFKSITNAVSSVINTVADTVTNTIKGALKDPIGTIAKVAAVATGNAWALPLISGADTIAHGGSIGDALKSAGTAYVAGQVAGAVSSGLDGAMGTGAAAEGAASNAAPSIFARVAGNAAGTAIAGGNPLNALISGGIGAGVGELTSQIPGFDSLPALAQTAIRNAMSSSLSSSLMGGQQPTQANVNSALAAGQAAAPNSQVASNMYQGEQLLTPKLETVAEAPPSGLDAAQGATPLLTAGITSPLTNSILAPMENMLGTPNNNLGTPNLGNDMNNAYGMGTMGPPNTMGNTYGMGGLNQASGAYGVGNGNQMAQNGQMPMYAKGGAIQHFADGGGADDSSQSSDFLKSLKELGAITGPAMSKQSGLMHLAQMGTPYSQDHSNVIPSLIEALRSRGIHLAHGGQPEEHPDDQSHPNYDGSPVFRTGGSNGLGGKYVEGKGDGTSDDISAMLANGEYVFSADVVSALGNGSNKAGADKLGEMVEAIRARARSSAPDKLPPDAKSPLEYLKPSRGNKNG